ncbi:MAG: nuclear transport factor 2 family protein [Janthinobacterium lividum]
MSDIDDLRAELAALTGRVGAIEDAAAIRRLHFAYGYYIDICMYDEVVELFARDGEAVFLSGIYRGHVGVARLYKTWFQQLFTGGRPGPLDGFLLDHFQMQDIITVADDRTTAKARFRALLAGGSHETMADKPVGLPLQFWEAGLYENDYVREDGVWKIARLDYIVQWQASYEEGWARQDAHLQPSTQVFPANPLGPDVLLDVQRPAWPKRAMVDFHYAHPVVAAKLAAA